MKCIFLDIEVCLPYSNCAWCGVNICKTEQTVRRKASAKSRKIEKKLLFPSPSFSSCFVLLLEQEWVSYVDDACSSSGTS